MTRPAEPAIGQTATATAMQLIRRLFCLQAPSWHEI